MLCLSKTSRSRPPLGGSRIGLDPDAVLLRLSTCQGTVRQLFRALGRSATHVTRRWSGVREWSQRESNPRHPACKAGALPTELWPLTNAGDAFASSVGLGGVEPPTSRLSGVRSNHLSYSPACAFAQTMAVAPVGADLQCPKGTVRRLSRWEPNVATPEGYDCEGLPKPPTALKEGSIASLRRTLRRCRAARGASSSVRGNPAAPSGTATLLRLSPSYRVHLRPLPPRRVGSRTSGALDFHGLTGGVYKARERIHRVIADTRLLAIPASRSRVADSDPN